MWSKQINKGKNYKVQGPGSSPAPDPMDQDGNTKQMTGYSMVYNMKETVKYTTVSKNPYDILYVKDITYYKDKTYHYWHLSNTEEIYCIDRFSSTLPTS